MNEIGSDGSRRSGNTKPRVNAAKKWCFTLNNYNEEEVEEIKKIGSNGSIVFGYEVGENGTPHLQGYIEFDKKVRPCETIKNKRIHWEKALGNRQQNINYCTKQGNYYNTFEEEYEPMKGLEFYPWQNDILEIVNKKEINRTIYWFWEEEGNTGKTTFAYHLCKHYNGIYLNGKAADMKSAIASCKKKPELCIFDYARSLEDYISYEGLESVKNGIFFNGKYESGMVMMRPPIVICFANFEPCRAKLSLDRWCIKEIKK